jgi:hypothetical protein
MEREFHSNTSNRFGNMRLLQPRLYLEKYINGWQCSICERCFELSQHERGSSNMSQEDVPTRLRREFEMHTCSVNRICAVVACDR